MKKNNMDKKQKQEEPKAAKLQIQEYVFDGQTPNRHASKEDWLGSYQERDDKNFKERAELYSEAMWLPYPNVALNTIRDHATDTLSLALMMGNKVSKVNVKLAKVPTIDIIHLNKETGDIFNARLLKATIHMSKLEESKTKTLNILRKVIAKHRILEIVRAKIDVIEHKVKEVIKLFKPLVDRYIPFF